MTPADKQAKDSSYIHCVVAKFGTAILTMKNGRLNEPLIHQWADALADLRDEGREVVIVSSGAIGAGVGVLNLPARPKDLPGEQAMAAVGQSLLMSVYGDAFRRRGYHVAQMLLTRSDMDDRQRRLNIRHCLRRLLDMGVVPIINENDTVSVEEICFGDNDTLAAMIATKVQAGLLLLFTDVDGLLDRDPRADRDARILPHVTKFTPDIEALASNTTSAMGTGGMRSKILAARAATRAGIPVVIANGRDPANLRRILGGEGVGTRFDPAPGAALGARDRWIALGAHSAGRRLIVDDGAARALIKHKKSLLAAGIADVAGQFGRGDVVEICDAQGRCLARGMSNYSAEDVRRIRGKKTAEIRPLLGDMFYEEVVHRDNMVVLETA